MNTRNRFLAAIAFALSACAVGCGDDSSSNDGCRESGPGRCLGLFTDAPGTLEADGTTTYEFTIDQGPACVEGDPFRTFYRPPSSGSSDTLLLFLPSGGAWLPTGSPLMTAGTQAPARLSLAAPHPSFDANHPEIGPHHLIYVPPCDGSVFAGDRDYTAADLAALNALSLVPRFYRGARNVSASIDVAKQHIPNPSRVIISGSGAGSMGAILAIFTIHNAFPDAKIIVIQDGSTGIAHGEAYPDFVADLLDRWSILKNMPTGCDGCNQLGHLTPYVRFALEMIPNLRIGTYQATNETTLPLFIAGSPNTPKLDKDDWRCEILNETRKLVELFPDRYGAFIVDQSATSYAQLEGAGDYEIDGYSYHDWLSALLSPTEAPLALSETPLTDLDACPYR